MRARNLRAMIVHDLPGDYDDPSDSRDLDSPPSPGLARRVRQLIQDVYPDLVEASHEGLLDPHHGRRDSRRLTPAAREMIRNSQQLRPHSAARSETPDASDDDLPPFGNASLTLLQDSQRRGQGDRAGLRAHRSGLDASFFGPLPRRPRQQPAGSRPNARMAFTLGPDGLEDRPLLDDLDTVHDDRAARQDQRFDAFDRTIREQIEEALRRARRNGPLGPARPSRIPPLIPTETGLDIDGLDLEGECDPLDGRPYRRDNRRGRASSSQGGPWRSRHG